MTNRDVRNNSNPRDVTPYGTKPAEWENYSRRFPPDDALDNAGFDDRNIIRRRFNRWATINNIKSSNPDFYGPYDATNNNRSDDLETFQYPNGFVSYSNIRTPSGTYFSIQPSSTFNTGRFSISPTPQVELTFDTTNGVLRGTPSAVLAPTTYSVTVSSETMNTFTTDFILTIYDPSGQPVIYYPSGLLTATSGSVFTLSPSGWYIPNGEFPILNPTLPTGLTFTSSNGVISGTPTQLTSPNNYQVRCTGAAVSYVSGQIFGDAFRLQVCGLANTGYPSALYPIAMSSFASGVATTLTPTLWRNISSAVLTPTLPTGLSFTSSTGVISGTPTTVTLSKVYTIGYTGSAGTAGSAITGSVALSLAVTGVGQPISGVTFEVTPADPTLVWDYSNPNFSAIYYVKDFRGSQPVTYTVLTGENIWPAGGIFKWLLTKCRHYRETIVLNPGYYPMFDQIGKAGYGWGDVHVASGIKGVAIKAASAGTVYVTVPGSVLFQSKKGDASATTSAGLFRDLSFSGIYFSSVANSVGYGAMFVNNTSPTAYYPGLHFYDCTFDGARKSKWLHRFYMTDDLRYIRCTFKDNWVYNNNSNEHAMYASNNFTNLWVSACIFSGISRNAVQVAGYDTVFGVSYPAPSGSVIIKDCSAYQCGLGSFGWDSATGQIRYLKGTSQGDNGTAAFTFAHCGSAWCINTTVSAGYPEQTVYGYTIPGGTGALVTWKNAFPETTDPNFYGTKILVLSANTFKVKNGTKSLVDIKNIRQAWVSGGTYFNTPTPQTGGVGGKALFEFSSLDFGQENNPNHLPLIASTILQFPLNSTTFESGYPPLVIANCQFNTQCQTLTTTQFANLVTGGAAPPAPPTYPGDGVFLYEAGWTNPVTGAVTP